MRRFGIRILLPAFQLGLYISLAAAGAREQIELSRQWAGWTHAPYSVPFAWAMAINLPVFVLAMPLSLVVVLACRFLGIAYDLTMAVIVGCLVPLFWFWIGKRLDQAFGVLPPRLGAPRIPDRSLLLGCGLIALCSIGLFWLGHGAYSIEMKLGLLNWVIVGIWAFARAIGRRARLNASAEHIRTKM